MPVGVYGGGIKVPAHLPMGATNIFFCLRFVIANVYLDLSPQWYCGWTAGRPPGRNCCARLEWNLGSHCTRPVCSKDFGMPEGLFIPFRLCHFAEHHLGKVPLLAPPPRLFSRAFVRSSFVLFRAGSGVGRLRTDSACTVKSWVVSIQ
jgi:hypothetical protein